MLVSSVKAVNVKDDKTGIQSIEIEETWSYLQSLPIEWDPEMIKMPEWKIVELIREDCIKNKKPFDKRFVTWQKSVESRNLIRSYRISKHVPTIDTEDEYYGGFH